MKNYLGIKGMKKEELARLVESAAKIKAEYKAGAKNASLANKTLVMLFEKPSTRTRLSFEAGMTQLGGHAIYFDFITSQISRGETISDTANVMSGYADAIMARLFKHADLLELSRHSSIPVINGLTDLEHPCQALADVLTMHELGKLGKGKTIAYVGDAANNIANSLMLACAMMGSSVRLVCPAGFPPNNEFVAEASKHSKVAVETDLSGGVAGADVVYTDVWVSMGMEEQQSERLKAFGPYQVTSQVMAKAKKDAIFMHDLPAHRGLEVAADVIDGKQSVVFRQAENRLHAQKALLLELMAGKK
ncbi:ornithine carbamoyltransferase [Candidatus Parvarchaeota archaeon]|nr:ornithine carbamoyltransferase [Candidatus Parvarchaeota archaeon]